MGIELLVATMMVTITVFMHAFGLLLLGRLTRYEAREEEKLFIQPLSLAGVVLTTTVVLGLFFLHGLEIWLYAVLYMELGAVTGGLREAVYFSTQTYAAIGFGDESLDPAWHIVAAIEGINGVILLGWSTAFFVTVMRRLSHF